MKVLYYKMIIIIFLFITVFINILNKTIAYVEVANLNSLIILMSDKSSLLNEIIDYLLYLLFKVDFNHLESILDYF